MFFRFALLGLAVSLSACSVLEGDKINYKSATKGPSLEVPPDLQQLTRDTRYAVPGDSVSAAAFHAGQASTGRSAQAAPQALGDVRIERDGNRRWLVVQRPADQLWEPVRDFWLEHGFVYTLERADLGLLETDWAENRAKLPQDIIRSTIGRVFDALYSTGERDKFRTRLERSPDGEGTEIYISHRGMVEVYTNERKEGTVWQPRPADAELEAEFLRRLMVQLGADEAQAATAAALLTVPSSARLLHADNGAPFVQLEEGFDRAWRRVGLALDRTGFTVEDRNRDEGVYFVRYVAPNEQAEKKGFFGKLFSRTPETADPVQLRIVVRSEGGQSTVALHNAEGALETSAVAERIVQILLEDLK